MHQGCNGGYYTGESGRCHVYILEGIAFQEAGSFLEGQDVGAAGMPHEAGLVRGEQMVHGAGQFAQR